MDQKDSMTSQEPGVKRVTIRWSLDFWEAVAIAATKRRTSVQVLVTEAIADKLGIGISGEATERAAN